MRLCTFNVSKLSPGKPIGRALVLHPRLRSVFFDQSLFSPQQQGGLAGANASVWTQLLYHILVDEVLGGQAPPLPFLLTMTGPDIMGWQMTMFEPTGQYAGVLELEPEGAPHHTIT